MPFISPNPSPGPVPPIGDISDFGVTVGATTATISAWIASLQGGGGAEAACYVGPDGTIGSVTFGTGFLHNCSVAWGGLGSGTYVITVVTPRASTACVLLVSLANFPLTYAVVNSSDADKQVIITDAAGVATDAAFTFALFVVA